jgi:hypothetical protein
VNVRSRVHSGTMGNDPRPARPGWVADALRLIDSAVRVYERDPDRALRLTLDAQMLLGQEAFASILELGHAGQLPVAGLPEFGQFVQFAEAGEVEIVTAVVTRNHEWVPHGGTAAWASCQAASPEHDSTPLSLTDELKALGMLGSSPPRQPAASTAIPAPRAVTPAGAQIPWQPPGHQVPAQEPKLAVEIIPTSLHGQNPRTQFGRVWWDATRKPAYAKAGYKCEICGGRGPDHPVELHERYVYDEHARPPVQKATGLIVLCPACHAVKHLYRTGTIAAKNNDPAALDNALRHMREVNGWTVQQQDRYLAQVRRDFDRREALGKWTTDFTALYYI